MSETKMRAKVRVGAVTPLADGTETVTFFGVSRCSGYPADGSDEDNTFARFTPSLSLNIHIANPALVGAHKVGDVFYLDFTPAG